MSSLFQELRVAARQLANRPIFSVVVISTLALGIGATTTCFAVLDAVAFRPLPFADPDRLVTVRTVDRRGGARSPITLDALGSLRQVQGTFSGVVAYGTRPATMTGLGAARQVQIARVSGDLFSVLGVPLQRGRPLNASDAGARVAVISDDLWPSDPGSNSDAPSATLLLDGETYAVIGVAGHGFGFPEDSRIWVPFDRTSGSRPVDIVARLDSGVSMAQANATIETAFGDGVAVPLRAGMIGAKQR